MTSIDKIKDNLVSSFADKTHTFLIETFFTTFDLFKNRNVPFRLFPKQKELLESYSNYQNNVTTKPRQAGVTTLTAGFIAGEMVSSSKDSPTNVLIIANKGAQAQEFLKKIKDFLDQVPRYFWGTAFYGTKDKEKISIYKTNNKSTLTLYNDSTIYARSSGVDASRGCSSIKWLIFDEAAFIENGDKVYTAAKLTTATGGHTIMISTPNGMDSLYYMTCHLAEEGKNNFHINKLKWYQDPRYNKNLKWLKEKPGKKNPEVITCEVIGEDGSVKDNFEGWEKLDYEGWKPSSPWYKEQCASLFNDSRRIAQELDVTFIGSGNNVLSSQAMDYIRDNTIEVPKLKDAEIAETMIWRPPMQDHRYIMIIDASTGSSDDFNVLEMIDIDAISDEGIPCYEQVLEYKGKIKQDEIGELGFKYGLQYNNALCVVDCIGGYGDATVIKMQSLGYKNLYVDDALAKNPTLTNNARGARVEDYKDRAPGFRTKTVRFLMLKDLELAITNHTYIIHSSRTLTEFNTWIWKEVGQSMRQDHMSGFHDDTITALGMGGYVANYSVSGVVTSKELNSKMIQSWMTSKSASETKGQENEEKFVCPFVKGDYSNEEIERRRKNPLNPFNYKYSFTKNIEF